MSKYTLLKKSKSLVNLVLKFTGLKVIRAGSDDLLLSKLKTSLLDIENIYREVVFGNNYPVEKDSRIKLMTELCGTSNGEALYIVKYLNDSITVDGDICEFGVAQGATSSLMANEIMDTSKNIWLFDSFEGLPKPTEHDELKDDIFDLGSMEAYTGAMATKVDLVNTRLSEIRFPKERTKIVSGFIEKTITSRNLPDDICFAYIDFDFYEPIKIALGYLDKNMNIGGSIVVDDYDFFSTGVKKVVDEFIDANKKKYHVIFPVKSAGHFVVLKKFQ